MTDPDNVSDGQCGAWFVNLFSAAAPMVPMLGQTACDPTIETCTTSATFVHRYEDYTEYNLFLGVVSAIFGFMPTAAYLTLWVQKSTEQQAILIADHDLYMKTWYFFCGSTFLQFGPYFIVWALLFGGLLSNPFPLKYLLKDIIVPTLIPIFVLTEGLWFYIISSERGNDDAGFKLVEPIIVALFYGFYAFPTAWMIMCDYEKAILYYDQTEKDAYKEYQAEQ